MATRTSGRSRHAHNACSLAMGVACLNQHTACLPAFPCSGPGNKSPRGCDAKPEDNNSINGSRLPQLRTIRHAMIKLYLELPHNDVQRAKLESRAAEGVPGNSRWRAGGSIY